jgi:regulator of sigma E protease
MFGSFSWILAIFSLGVLIVVHEAGHYFVARWSKMRVEKFSVGFGPPILKWKRGETQFQIAPILLGGFAQITGMNPHEELDNPDDPHLFPNRPLYQRFLTIFAGPATNILFSAVLVFIVLAIAGARRSTPTGQILISAVPEGGAATGVLQADDVIVSVDGQKVAYGTTALKDRVQQSGGRPMVFGVKRGEKELTVQITPRRAEESASTTALREALDQAATQLGVTALPGTDLRLGVAYGAEATIAWEALSLPQAAWEAVRYPVVKSGQILGMLWAIVTRQVEGEITSVVGMTQIIKGELDNGWVPAFELLALLNVYLGLFNLLPLPALDGGRLVFLLYEMGTRRRPNPKFEAAVHMVGFLFLFAVMILAVYKDIARMVKG